MPSIEDFLHDPSSTDRCHAGIFVHARIYWIEGEFLVEPNPFTAATYGQMP